MSDNRRRPRDYDRESGKNRVAASRQKRQPSPPEEDYDSPYDDRDLEEELEMPRKDDSRRAPKPRARPPPDRVPPHGIQGDEESGQELAMVKAKQVEAKVAPHMQVLLAATYHIGFSSIVRPAISTYIPSCRNMFSMSYAIMELMSENTYLNEMFPGFFSVAFYTYVGYMYFYQILRAKDYVGQGQLSRIERRVLRTLKSVGEPESWPIPAPLIEFIRSLGAYKSSNPVFSWIVPTFPDFAGLTSGGAPNQGFTRYGSVDNIQRVPPLPAYVEFLRLLGTGTTVFSNGIWIPTGDANGHLTAAFPFLGINDSTAGSAAFQALAFSDGWLMPTEGPMNMGVIQRTTKTSFYRRLGIDAVSGNLTTTEDFTRTTDGLNKVWIRQLLVMGGLVSRFFPGSTTMAAIDPVCHLGTLTAVDVNTTTPRVAVDHRWYRGRRDWTFTFKGYDDTDQGRILSRVGIATGTRMSYSANVIPIGTIGRFYNGPFFIDDPTYPTTERMEIFRFEGTTRDDPVQRFAEQISTLYAPRGIAG